MRVVFAETNPFGAATRLCGYHYARIFAEAPDKRVLYLSAPISPFHLIAARHRHLNRLRFNFWRSSGRRERENLIAYVPLTLLPIVPLPVLNSPWVCEHSLRLTLPNLRRWIARRGFIQPDALLLHSLQLHGLVDLILPKLTILRIEDDIDTMPGIAAVLRTKEVELIRRADIILTTSPVLYEKIATLRGAHDVYMIGNACEFEHFHRPGLAEPTDLARIPRPRAVYVGGRGNWLDQELVGEAARRLPQVAFVMIGPDLDPTGVWRGVGNVYNLGPRPYEQIPAYLAHASVGLIPFRQGRVYDCANPIKLYEYMAAGLPVVATMSRTLASLGSPARVAPDTASFVEAIRAALDQKNSSAEISFASRHSWRANASRILEIITAHCANQPIIPSR